MEITRLELDFKDDGHIHVRSFGAIGKAREFRKPMSAPVTPDVHGKIRPVEELLQ